jgi:hypothetical protein
MKYTQAKEQHSTEQFNGQCRSNKSHQLCMCAGAAGMILLDNEPNGFRVTSKPPPVVNLTLATVPQV